jgi:hypothetical protein
MMTAKSIDIRQRRSTAVRLNKAYILTVLAGVIFSGAVAALAFDAFTGKIGILPPRFETIKAGDHDIIKVPANSNLQAAINRAKSGDVIELQAGATYYGEIVLPNRPLTDYVTIQSSALARLPEDQRVGPEQASLMAKIVTKDGKPTVSAEAGANHYRFAGIEFAPASPTYVYNLVLFGTDQTRLADVPHHLEIDRSYVHTYKTGVARRGIALNSADSTIKNSYIEGFAFPGEETQGICGWTGTRDVKIINNYVEGGAENIMFGGSDPVNADMTPTNIEVRGNHLNKPVAWKKKVTHKTHFELKNAKNVLFTGNYLENNWEGSAFRITVRNQDGGAPFSTVEDVVVKDNVVNGAGEGFNILGKDDTHPSQTMKRLTITNNLFLNIGGQAWDGSGYFIQIADGENILIANNTVFNSGNIATFYGTMPRDLTFRDNIMGHGLYGIHGIGDMKSAKSIFQNNVFVNNLRVSSGDLAYPSGNIGLSDFKSVGFADAGNNDYRLTPGSKYKGKGSNVNAAAVMK